MFIYERNGKLNIMVAGGAPAEEGKDADVVVESVLNGEGKVVAKVTVNGKEVSTSTFTLEAATADTLGGIKVGTGLSIDENGVLSAQ